MSKTNGIRRGATWASLATLLFVFGSGMTCPPGGDGGGGGGALPIGNTPPRILITSINTPAGNNIAQQGQTVTINFTGGDAESASVVRVFATQSETPSSAFPIINILTGFQLVPGQGSGSATWVTTGVAVGSYYIFAEIDDQSFDPLTGSGNPPVRVTSTSQVQVTPLGSQPLTMPPQVVFVDPLPNLGLSAEDDVTVRYIYADTDSQVSVTLLLDKDKNPTNDDINNPGNPNDPATNIIILPSSPRRPTDPTFPVQSDTDEIRRNPRTLPATVSGVFPFPGAPIAGAFKEFRFSIDFSQIPPRSDPYYVRATVTDGANVVHNYAIGSVTISNLASGTVDLQNIGFSLAGSRYHGTSARENLGTDFVSVSDLDFDSAGDFMIASRFAARFSGDISGPGILPPLPGASYLVFGRRKTPFPPDSNGNGRPDVVGPDGSIVDFPEVPAYLPNPYDSRNVGRFGGILSANSIGGFFRGSIYGMPVSYSFNDPPEKLRTTYSSDPNNFYKTGGLTSIARIDMTQDGVPDLVFGLPYTAAYDHIDDDTVDGGCDNSYGFNPGPQPPDALQPVLDRFPNFNRCGNVPMNDDMGPVDQGIVIMVDGTADIANIFRRFVDAGIAGQFDMGGTTDDEGIIHVPVTIPPGMRLRGGWYPTRLVRTEDNLIAETHTPDNEFGTTIAAIPTVTFGGVGEDLLVSSPGENGEQGEIHLFLVNNYISENFRDQEGIFSYPAFARCQTTCVQAQVGNPTPPPPTIAVTYCLRGCFVAPPASNAIFGESVGDRLGYAKPAGDLNQDSRPDIVCGAPGANRKAINPLTGQEFGATLVDNGIAYIIFTPNVLGTTNITTLPRLEIRGSHDGDQFGLVQQGIGDINAGNVADVAIAAESFDGPLGQDQGLVCVVYGDRPVTGERGFDPEQVGTSALPGIRFYGATAGAKAGRDVDAAGDFNSDGRDDLLISCPGEIRSVNGQQRQGVAYLIFGGEHLDPTRNGNANNAFNLSQVGSSQLPGIVFIGRTPVAGAIADAAPIEYVGGVGDVDGDGFDDIMIGMPKADFVFGASPNQRREDAGEAFLVYGNNFGTNRLP